VKRHRSGLTLARQDANKNKFSFSLVTLLKAKGRDTAWDELQFSFY